MAYRYQPEVMRPSEQLASLLMGKTKWEDAPEAIRSWARKPIFDAACMILKAPDQEARRRMLAKIPDAIRPRVEDEVKRMWRSPPHPDKHP